MSTASTLKVIELSKEESLAISKSLSDVKYCPEGSFKYIKSVRKIMWGVLPDDITSALEDLKKPFPEFAGVVIKNLPVDADVKGSPKTGETGASFKNGCMTENVISGMGAVLGEPYSIAHEGSELVNNLTPHKEKSTDFTGLGSSVELDFHIENAAQVYQEEGDTSPFALMLMGVREDSVSKPKTRISDARVALKMLSEDDIDVLRQALYVIKVPHRWRTATATPRDNTGLVPVLSGPINAPRITVAFYPDMVVPVTTRAQEALANLHKAIRDVSVGIHIDPGTMVIINNNFMLHSRDKFIANYDADGNAYRWVQRVFVTKNLWPFRNFSRISERVYNAKMIESENKFVV
ncbi:TPA: TauD/TfdA family dioxygenase [Enterobacter hormaechei subsp. xiangfangensis]|nr:TauD/TfdA family dioxygenase [Enterobacter hormaechei subsp. xiangfangensis]